MMENKSKMIFVGAYEAPEVQVTEVLVEQGFQGSLRMEMNPGELDYGVDEPDYNEFA